MSAKSINESKLIPVFVVALILATSMIGQAYFGLTGTSKQSSETVAHVAFSRSDDPQPLAPGMIFTVTKTADTGDGVCNADCSLREAMTAANANLGLDTIKFQIGTGLNTILPTSALPTISDPVVIDGTTQPGFSGSPLIQIDGSNAGNINTVGFNVASGGSTIRGLIINGFRSAGIQLGGTGSHLIVGNYIGTNASGTARHSNIQNNGTGVYVLTANNIIGGTTAGDRNIIAGNINQNGSTGIFLQFSGATGNKIIGNFIGTDVTGTLPIPHNNAAITSSQGASNNVIGGLTLERNVIAGGNSHGIILIDASNTKIMRNLIGISPAGVPLGLGSGVRITGLSHDNVIGGPNSGEGNVIAYGIEKGVWVEGQATKNAILGNAIFGNGFGIDLDANGVAPNDLNDGDPGSNNLQNFPLITSATPNGGSTAISGTLNSVANLQYRIELFSNPNCNPSGNGEGRGFLGSTSVTLNGNNGNFSLNTSFDVQNRFLTATATDPNGNTSEFSPCFLVGNPASGMLQFSANSIDAEEGDLATVTVVRVGGSTGAASVQYATGNGSATAGADYVATSGTLNWANGDSSPKTFTVQINTDAEAEGQETIGLQLSNATGAPLGNPVTSTLKISNVTPKINILNVTKAEGNSGTTSFVFDVTLTFAWSQPITVHYTTIAIGSAMEGNDYQPASGLLTFTPGQVSQPITVLVNGDADNEPDETFHVELDNPFNAVIQNFQATGKILNDDSSQANTIQFSQASYNVQEDLAALVVTVTRSGNTSTAASVSYETTDGVATQKADFEYASGKINFAPGESSKTFSILINEDMHIEGNEAFNILLKQPSGATLGQQSTVNVSITDDSPESPGNPIDNAQAFVTMQYHDFLNRDPDPSGLAFWTNEITSCGANQECIDTKRTNVSAAFFLSIEFQETGYLVYRTHKAAFDVVAGGPIPVRLADFLTDTQQIGRGVVVNQQGWQQVLENNKQAFFLEFVQREAFEDDYPTSESPAEFVDDLFDNTNFTPSATERDAAIAEFGNAVNTINTSARARALRRIAENPGLGQQEFNRAFVLMQYFGYLRRNPNDAPEAALNFDGYNFWLNKLNQFGGNFVNAEMVKAFILSGEYRQRFGQ